MRQFTIAHLAWESDGITALYEGDNLVVQGDYYHDKIDTLIEGFLMGLDHVDEKYNRDDIYISDEHYDVAYGPSPPETLTELKSSYPWSDDTDTQH